LQGCLRGPRARLAWPGGEATEREARRARLPHLPQRLVALHGGDPPRCHRPAEARADRRGRRRRPGDEPHAPPGHPAPRPAGNRPQDRRLAPPAARVPRRPGGSAPSRCRPARPGTRQP
jgi:hypothetical protein